MMRSLYSAVSGLKAHQTRMDVIGNNIANVNTVAYKSQSMTFSEVFYQTTQTASGPNAETGKGGTNAMQIGLGSSVGSIATAVGTSGASERTDNPYDLQISGDAFFIVRDAGTTFFTRAGNFTVDESGALVTAGGASVMGWQVDQDGNVVKDLVTPLYVTSPNFTYTAPVATTAVSIKGNLNQSSMDDINTTINFYDSLGNSYQASLTLSNPTENAGVTSYSIACTSVSKNGGPSDLLLDFGTQTLNFNSVTGAAMLPDNENITFTISDPTGGTANINDLFGGYDGTGGSFRLDATGVTMYASATKLSSELGVGDKKEGAGKEVGSMTSVGIDGSGYIVASYSNGDVRKIGQIAVTTFANPEGLEKVGDNLYSATMNSGQFDGIGEEVTAGGGSISSGVLEMSNVDLSSEFTKMITTQRGFQANSRIITVSDTLLEELINLKR